MPDRNVLFGASLGQWNGADAADAAGRVRLGTQADRDGLDLFTVADHPYFGDKLDAYALTAFLLGQTERITGMVAVTNLPSRPAPVLARTLTSLSTLSGGRIILGIGAGAIWDMIVKLGIPRLDGGSAVRAMAEAITLVRALSGGGEPVTFDGEFYHVSGLDPAAAPAPRVFTGSIGPKSLAVTGELADGWIPSGGSDWLSQLYRESRPRVDAALRRYGQLHGLVSNAGLLRSGPILRLDDSDLRLLLDVHVTAPFRLLRAIGGYWRAESKAGRAVEASVVLTTSAAGLYGFRAEAAYSAAKAAVAMLARVGADELGRYGATVNAVAPVARTRLTEWLGEAPPNPGDDPLAADHVAPAIAWLLGPAARTVTGRVLEVGNGRISAPSTWQPGPQFPLPSLMSAETADTLLPRVLASVTPPPEVLSSEVSQPE